MASAIACWEDMDLDDATLTTQVLKIARKRDRQEIRLLKLGGNWLTTLPGVLFVAFPLMNSLSLIDNRFSTLPDELVQLSQLTCLHANGNLFSFVPEVLFEMTMLVELDLQSNQIELLPVEIGQLVRLTALYLDDNQLVALPTEMRKLTNLHTYAFILFIQFEPCLATNPPLFHRLCLSDNKMLSACLQRNVYNDHVECQRVVREIALRVWQPRARLATITWLLSYKQIANCTRGPAVSIARLVYESHDQDIWDDADPARGHNKKRLRFEKSYESTVYLQNSARSEQPLFDTDALQENRRPFASESCPANLRLLFFKSCPGEGQQKESPVDEAAKQHKTRSHRTLPNL